MVLVGELVEPVEVDAGDFGDVETLVEEVVIEELLLGEFLVGF